MKTGFNFLGFIFLALTITACLPQFEAQKNQAQGTQDGGGGDIEHSTDAEVRAAVQMAKEMLYRTDTMMALSLARPKLADKAEEKEFGQLVVALMFPGAANRLKQFEDPRYIEIRKKEDWSDEDFAELEQLEAKYFLNVNSMEGLLSLSKVYFEESGPCPAPDKANADASVSTFSYGADICFSLPGLRRIPRESLVQHVFGLWVHEVAHLNGYGERMAELAQAMAVKAYPKAVLSTTFNIPFRIRNMISDAQFSLGLGAKAVGHDVDSFYKSLPAEGPARTRYHLGQASGRLSAAEELLDEDADMVRIFVDPKTAPLIKELVKELRTMNGELWNVGLLSDADLASEKGTGELQRLHDSLEVLEKKMQPLLVLDHQDAEASQSAENPAKP